MRVALEELMKLMGVGYVLGPYDTAPWSFYADDKGVTCNAEVRMNSDSNEISAEVQFMYDDPPEGKPPMEQICNIRATPGSDGQWNVVDLLLNGGPLEEEIYNWEEKSCNFFAAVASELSIEKIPDIEELIEEHFHNRERLHDQQGGGGGKSPKINTGSLSGMKKGGGF